MKTTSRATKTFLAAGCAVLAATPLTAQTFSIAPTQIEISVAPSFNHTQLRVPVASASPGFDVGQLNLGSDSGWVSATADSVDDSIVLTFATADLLNATYTATITASLGGESDAFFVKAYLAPLNIFKLKDDPYRSRTYGIQMDGLNLGSVVMLDPLSGAALGNVTVGKKPTDLAVANDGSELFVINAVDETISVIGLPELRVKQTLALTQFDNWGASDTTANVGVGPGSILYYTDGAWAPILRVLNRTNGQVLQSIDIDGYGFGDLGVTSDRNALYGWVQYGWSAGWAGSYIARFTINGDGTLTRTQSTDSQYPTVIGREPFESPVLISNDDALVFIKQLAVAASDVTQTLHTFPGSIYSITPGGEVAATDSALYEVETGLKLYDLPRIAAVQAITTDYARLVYFDTAARQIETINLLDAIGPELLNREISPANGSITLAPAELRWQPLPGVNRYQAYLGTSATEVANASPSSPTYLGESTGISIAVNSGALTPGTTYYWRVDAVTESETVPGQVFSFTVSIISSSESRIDVATVTGHSNLRTGLELNSAAPGAAWQMDSAESWISFSADEGTTPAALEVILDASALSPGVHTGSITVSDGPTALFSIPVKLRVDPLKLTLLKTDPSSVYAYGVSEDTVAPIPRAYLLEINTLTENIERVLPVGSSVTDLAIHPGDNRIYVPNWLQGSLLAIDRTTFQQVRAYAFAPFGGMGYSEGDVYRVSPGGPGRLVVEEQDQWIDIRLFNTLDGATLASTGAREGGGGTTSNGRFYYHGDNNSSGAELHKYDLLGDQFSHLASTRVSPADYYGSRVVVVAEDGNRIFWNGVVHDPELNPEWVIGEHIYAASKDGRFAFGASTVFDVAAQSVVTTVTPATTVKAYNSLAEKLVYALPDSLGFMRLQSERVTTPADGAIVFSPATLQWEDLPVPATYRLYLGISQSAVAVAGPNSPEFQGELAGPSFTIHPALASGTWYWRVDAVTAYGIVPGPVLSFTVSPVIPSVTSISEITFPGRDVEVAIDLSSLVADAPWTASSPADWIGLSADSGVTPATLTVTLDVSDAVAGSRSSTITINNDPEYSFEIPVELLIESFQLTHLKADPASARVYAISENTATVGSPAYLLEIDSATEEVTRVVAVGTSVSDLAIHNGDNRLYVPNWRTGFLQAVNKDSFEVEQTYTFQPFAGIGYGGNDIYRVAAGGPGRLMIEEQDQWIDIVLFNTTSGTTLASAFVREGGGGFGPTGRYYYHGENNSSGAEIRKYDVLGDQLSHVGSVRVESASYYGSRVVVVSQDGSRVFWNGSVFDANLVEEWEIGEHIYACSVDGRYAFAFDKIYDVAQRRVALGMPVATTVSAFNSTSSKLVVQQGSALAFYPINDQQLLPAPQVSADAPSINSVRLHWTDRSLEAQFTLQQRVAGNANWTDVASPAQNATEFTVTGLTGSTSYEFRIKADAGTTSSPWSNVILIVMPEGPPSIPVLGNPGLVAGNVSLSWSDPTAETEILLERRVGAAGVWNLLATLPADTTGYIDSAVTAGLTYYYRLKARNGGGDSSYSGTVAVTIPQGEAPSTPGPLIAFAYSGSSLKLHWSDVASESGYRIERSPAGQTAWSQIAELGANAVEYQDWGLFEGESYVYRVRAFNASGNSAYSNQAAATVREVQIVLIDDFDPYVHAVWTQIYGASNLNGGQGFPGSKVLWFGAASVRHAITKTVDVRLGGHLRFKLRGGNSAADGATYWDDAEAGENVVLEFRTAGAWTELQTFDLTLPAARQWNDYEVLLPAEARSTATQFRWRQPAFSGASEDVWALEDVGVYAELVSPPNGPAFVEAATLGATYVDVFWGPADRAAGFVVEQLMSGGAWQVVGATGGAATFFRVNELLPETSYTFRVKAFNEGGESGYGFAGTTTWSHVGEWLYTNFGPYNEPPDMLTPDVDGITLTHRFAFNLDSSEPVTWHEPGIGEGGLPAMWYDPASGRLEVEFLRRDPATAPGITYIVQFSSDLIVWEEVSVPAHSTSIDWVWERVRFVDPAPGAGLSKRFTRVKLLLENP